MQIDIDANAGFCFGVVNAVKMAERELERGELYCVGDLVHNDVEMARLSAMGLKSITPSEMSLLPPSRVLFRAHGEPPSSYRVAKERGLEVIDASCPVVLELQSRVRRAYEELSKVGGTVVIYGEKGHAEVIALLGQMDGRGVVVDSPDDLDGVDFSHPVALFSQTTESLEGFQRVAEEMVKRGGDRVEIFDTICRRVANRIPLLRSFAEEHDLVLFVSDRKSSNGKRLFDICKGANPRTYFINGAGDIREEMLSGVQSLGISGANSTPMRLMEEVKRSVEMLVKDK